ncbi:M14 family metallopeptidase [Parafilimonas terrae]|uniref:Zinc carboxypeptidase n=1 Tax=Parafilimonas terrae TaxID=1465490 RepID=A0A1I5XAF7_9BACT|nr:M14 family metallopeptidase [Parafilimonas terrae]SFQ28959.1 Zinc carboxypeptidase [Parafilimonas terrae]
MQKNFFLFIFLLVAQISFSQNLVTVFEKSNGNQSATYFECIDYYKQLAATFPAIKILTGDTTDAGYPLHVVLFAADKNFNINEWHKQRKVAVLVNNGIHPGEPDGIDASMMLLRDLGQGKIKMPDNVVLAVIPVYNIGGSLNRGSFSRVNQNGPERYGFRGNAQNLDLNRDFIKADSKNAFAFEKIFQQLNPDIFIDNHVSDGADYQHTITLLTTLHNKLGGEIGSFLHDVFEPALYKGMQEKNWDMCPYVNFEESSLKNGWEAYYDAPRYSTGYAALFETIAFMPETHMLKPYADRVKSTYSFMQTVIEQASKFSDDILAKRKASLDAVKRQKEFALSWKVDSSKYDNITFKGYDTSMNISDVTGLPRYYYNHSKPFEKEIKFYDYFIPSVSAQKPKAYIIPQGLHDAINRLKLNNVTMHQLQKDTVINVEYYKVDDYKAMPKAYEKHHRNNRIKLSTYTDTIHFLKGDYIIYTGQNADRYIVETLEPLGDDSFFSWNFFDAIFQRKEYYSNYRWEDVAAAYLKQHPEVRSQLEDKKKTDAAFAASAQQQLYFVYTHSPYSEPGYMRIPVFRIN